MEEIQEVKKSTSTKATVIVEANEYPLIKADYPGWVFVEYSATGEAPATHYLSSGWMASSRS